MSDHSGIIWKKSVLMRRFEDYIAQIAIVCKKLIGQK